jgi:predicted dinucleotide-binding enzyme
MRIAVIGTGNIGSTLGNAFASAGHDVVFGSRDPSRDEAGAGTGARVADIGDALAGAEVAVLAVPGGAVADLVRDHRERLAGLLVVDAANSIGSGGPAHHHDLVLSAVPTARYARAFNTLGFENMQNPTFGTERADMFFSCDEQDQPVVESLVAAVGLRPVYVGAGQHDVVDGLLRLWFALSMGQRLGRRLAFRMLTDADSTAT